MQDPYDLSATTPLVVDISTIRVPATALIVVASLAIALGVFGLIVDLIIVVSGSLEMLEARNRSPIPKTTQILVRTVWGITTLLISCYVLYGAIGMRKLTNYWAARRASIVAMIPLLGPCLVLGIPFGIWAFAILCKPEVISLFATQESDA